jgi:hypothetical protein
MGVAGESHRPITQMSPAGQELPQLPQCRGLVSRSKQPSGQFVSPAEQGRTQLPVRQDVPAGHEFPHLPQLLLSACRSTQVLLHTCLSEGQTTDSGICTMVGLVVTGVRVAGVVATPGGGDVGSGVGSSVLTIT